MARGRHARHIWRWPPPRLTSGPCSLPPAAMATVFSCQSGATRALRPKLPHRHHRAPGNRDHTDPQERADRGSRAVRKPGCPAACAPPKPCAPPGAMAGRSGSAGPDAMSEAGSRRTLLWFVRNPLPGKGCGALSLRRAQRRPRRRPPSGRNPDPHHTDEPILGPRNGQDRSRRLTPEGKGPIMPWALITSPRRVRWLI